MSKKRLNELKKESYSLFVQAEDYLAENRNPDGSVSEEVWYNYRTIYDRAMLISNIVRANE